MNMKQLDKKQMPQFAALCVLSAGVLGYLVVHLAVPGPASAGTRGPAAPAPALPGAGPATAGVSTPSATGAAPDAAAADAPPPSPAMHDPFAVGYVDPTTVLPTSALPGTALAGIKAPALPKLPPAGKQFASLAPLPVSPLSVGPGAAALPGTLGGFSAPPAPSLPAAPALPAAPSAPAWTVTGVLQGATGKVAILRDGDARRIVRSGDFVDSTYRVIGVSRTLVTLRHGKAVYQLVLGAAAKSNAPAAPFHPAVAVPTISVPTISVPTISVPAISAPAVAAPRSAATLDTTIIPIYHSPRTHLLLAHLRRQESGLTLTAETLSMPKPGHSVSPAKVASAISLGLRLLDGSVLARKHKE